MVRGPFSFGGAALCEIFKNLSTECRVAKAYMRLAFVSEGENGSKAISLVRFGSYEVRLVEFAQAHFAHDTQLWIELYAHNLKRGLDSCACSDLEEAALAAEELISQARQLHEEDQPDASGKQDRA
jgi:hypothetical protein